MKKDLERLSSSLSIKIGTYNRDNPFIKEIEKEHVIIKGVETFYGYSGFSKAELSTV